MVKFWPTSAPSSPFNALNTSTIIRYSNAIERLGKMQVNRLNEAFHRARGNQFMTREVFHDVVIAETFSQMPRLVWSALYDMMDERHKDRIGIRSFLCIVATILHGTDKEKMKFLFLLITAAVCETKSIAEDEFSVFISTLLEESRDPSLVCGRKTDTGEALTLSSFVAHFFKHAQGRFNYELRLDQFKKGFHNLADDSILHQILERLTCLFQNPAPSPSSKSLLLNSGVSNRYLFRKCWTQDPVEPSLPSIGLVTVPNLYEGKELTHHQLSNLVQAFYLLRTRVGGGKVSLNGLLAVLSPDIFSAEIITQLYAEFQCIRPSLSYYGEHSKHDVTLREMISALICTCVSSKKDIVRYLFRLFDNDQDQQLSRKELIDWILFTYPNTSQYSIYHQKEMVTYVEAKKIATRLMENNDGDISVDTLLNWWNQNENEHTFDFVKKIRDLVHIKCGDLPMDAKSERHIIASRIELYTSQNPGTPGTVWYVVNTKWWLDWLHFVGASPEFGDHCTEFTGVCMYCQKIRKVAGPRAYSVPQKIHVGPDIYHEPNPDKIDNFVLVDNATSTEEVIMEEEVSSSSSTESSQGASSSSSLRGLRRCNSRPKNCTSGDPHLSVNLVYPNDYVLLNASTWWALSHWYGCESNDEIAREVIDCEGVIELELYPLLIKVKLLSTKNATEDYVTTHDHGFLLLTLSKMTTLKDLIELSEKVFSPQVDSKFIKLWQRHPVDNQFGWELLCFEMPSNKSSKHHQMDESSLFTEMDTLIEMQLIDGHEILIEMPDEDNQWVLNSDGSFVDDNDFSVHEVDDDAQDVKDNSGKGTFSSSSKSGELAATSNNVVGLYNLGNTCYMNSALQCISRTPLLRDYFIRNFHLYDVNLNNQLGMEGLVAMTFGDLVHEMYAPAKTPRTAALEDYTREEAGVFFFKPKKRNPIAPRKFKHILGKLNHQFENIEQQDAQEFLSIFLNGLNEDLIRNEEGEKPYAELPDSNGQPDSVIAREWWMNHIQRDPSIITALFSGQFKSRLQCQKCHFESARFEPFSFLQLSLPEPSLVRFTVYLHLLHNSQKPIRASIEMKKILSVQNLVDQILVQFLPFVTIDSKDVVVVQKKDNVALIRRIVSVHEHLDTLDRQYKLHLYQLQPLDSALLYYRVAEMKDAFPPSPTFSTSNLTTESAEKGSNPSDLDTEHEIKHELALREKKRSLSIGKTIWVRVEAERFVLGKILSISQAGAHAEVEITTSTHCKKLLHHCHIIRDLMVTSCPISVTIFILQRRIQLVPFYFNSPIRRPVFSLPFIWRFSSHRISGKTLYEQTLRSLDRFYHETSHEVMDGLVRQSPPLDHPPFCLTRVHPDGTSCSVCSWTKQCTGCIIPRTTDLLEFQNEECISIDWKEGVLDATMVQRMQVYQDDKSYINITNQRMHQQRKTQGFSLSDCMDEFCSQENVTAYCSSCTSLNGGDYIESKQIKTFNIWAMPPILIIQLKRFELSPNNQWLKRMNVVDFPITDLDLAPFLASAQNENTQPPQEQPSAEDYATEIGSVEDEEDEEEETDRIESSHFPIHTTSRSETKYDLYGVVNHIGILGAGHYTAYVRESDDENVETEKAKWWLVDDCEYSRLDRTELEQPSNEAYLLFYVRQDLVDTVNATSIASFLPPKPDAVQMHPASFVHRTISSRSGSHPH